MSNCRQGCGCQLVDGLCFKCRQPKTIPPPPPPPLEKTKENQPNK
jgi:hypothetical protein